MEEQRLVGRTLDVGFAAQRVHAAAGHAHVAQQELDDAHGPDVLHADGVLGPTHGIQDGAGFFRFARGGVGFVHGHEFLFGCARDGDDLFDVIPIIMLLQDLVDATWVFQGHVPFGHAGLVHFKGPGFLVVLARGFVETGEQAVIEPKVLGDDERCVGVVQDIFFEGQIVIQNVLDHAAQETDVRA